MLTEVIIGLEEWGTQYPTGAIANDGSVPVDSEYCETLDEFTEFFGRYADRIDSNTNLVFRINANDIENEKLIDFVKDIKHEWEILVWGDAEPDLG